MVPSRTESFSETSHQYYLCKYGMYDLYAIFSLYSYDSDKYIIMQRIFIRTYDTSEKILLKPYVRYWYRTS